MRRWAGSVLAVASASLGGVWWMTGSVEPVWVLASLTLGQAVALTWFLAALSANPLTYRYLSGYLRRRPRLGTTPSDGPAHPVAGAFESRGFARGPATRDGTVLNGPVWDLFQTPGREVTAVVGRSSGSLSIVTPLGDGRILQTSTLQSPPHRQFVVNTVAGAEPQELLASHLRLVGVFANGGVRPVSAPTSLWSEIAAVEHEAYQALGPVLGSLWNLSGGRSWLRLLVPIRSERVLAQGLSAPELKALRHQQTPRRSRLGLRRQRPRLAGVRS